MNAGERKALDRIDGIVKTIGSLTPKNPADINAITHNLRIAVAAAKRTTTAVMYLRYGEWADVDRELAGAEKVLKVEPEPSRFDHARSVPTGQEASDGGTD